MGFIKKKYPHCDYRWAPEQLNSYGHFSRYYDLLGWSRFTDSSFSRLKAVIRNSNPRPESVIDFGCGTGDLLMRLSEMGFTGAGIDISEGMLQQARLKLDSSEFELVAGDICDTSIDRRFPLATCFFDTLNHIPNKRSLKRFLKNARSHLADGGKFVFDFLTPEGLADWEGTDITSEEEFTIIQKGKHHPRANRAVIEIEGFVKNPHGYYDRFYQKIIERGITVEEMTELLRGAGFEKIILRGYFYGWELEEGGRIFGVAK